MPILHKQVVGADGAKWLPWAVSRLNILVRDLGEDAYFDREYLPASDVRVTVKQAPPFQYVRIFAAGAAYFEFATSAWPIVRNTASQEGSDFGAYTGAIVGVNLEAKGADSLVARASIAGGRRTTTGADTSKVGRPYQADLINEPVGYPTETLVGSVVRYLSAVYESWAPGSPYSGIPIRGTENIRGMPGWFHAGPVIQYTGRDVLFDVPFAEGERANKLQRAYLRGDADWPRACGMQTVTDMVFGTRTFAIYVDAFNQFFAFPLSAIDVVNGVAQNVDPTMVKSAAPTFPDWAYVPTTKLETYYGGDFSAERIAQGLVDFPELDWKFNHTGTKCAAIVHERSAFANDTAYWAVDASATPFGSTEFNYVRDSIGILGRQTQYGTLPGYNEDHHFYAPGVLELDVTITLTGSAPDDFSLALTVHEKRAPSTMTRWALLVGYVWHDCPVVPATDPVTYLARAGDLVAFDLERWCPKTGDLASWDALGGTTGNLAEVISLRNLDTDTEIYARMARPILAADLKTLSLAQQAYSLESGADPNYVGVAVTVKGYLKEVLLPATAADPAHAASMAFWAQMDGRAIVDALIVADSRWERVLPTPAGGDGWSNTEQLAYREFFARSAKPFALTEGGGPFMYDPDGPWDVFKTGSAGAMGAPENSAEEDVRGRWLGYPTGSPFTQPGPVTMFVDNPRWGWHCYASRAADFTWLSPNATFYTHPNGTWAYWDNAHVYVPASTLTSYTAVDPAAVEHVIFDRIHFERRDGAVTRTLDTTFFALYNEAITKFSPLERAQKNFQPLTLAHVRSIFGKANIVYGANTTLVLLALWDGTLFYMPDPGVYDGPGLGIGQRGGQMIGLRFDQAWYDADLYAGTRPYPASIVPHVRFANPLLVGV